MNDTGSALQERVVELPHATEEQRKAISRVVSAIQAARVMSFEKVYAAAVGSLEGYGLEDKKNLGKGSIAQWKSAKLFRWIVENHLALGCEIAPEVFDPSLLTQWKDFVREHGTYDTLTHEVLGTMGLTQRSAVQPIADDPIRLGQEFLLHLNNGIAGQLLALEVHAGKTYPMALHSNATSLTMDVKPQVDILPTKADGLPDPLSETDDKGLRRYIFIVANEGIFKPHIEGMVAGHPIGLDKLDQIALAFKGVDPANFEVHCLNVVFN